MSNDDPVLITMLSGSAIVIVAILKYIDRISPTPAAHFPFRGVCPSANFFEHKPLEKVDLQTKQFPQEWKWTAFAKICSTTNVRSSILEYPQISLIIVQKYGGTRDYMLI